MRIAVLGAGAVGSAIAAALVDAGRDIVLIARGRRLSALRAGPLRIESNQSARYVQVPTCAMAEIGNSTIDIAICCVKMNGLEPALQSLRPALKPGAVVLTLQNGVEAHEVAGRILPGTAVVAGRMHGFFEMSGDTVRHIGVAPSILLGSPSGRTDAELMVRNALASSGIAAEASPDIVLALWEKFLLAASIGSVGAAMQIPAGRILASPEGAAMLHQAMAEIVALARHRGIALESRHIDATLAFVASFPPDATTSLQRDLAAGLPSEFGALTAAIPRLAAESGFSASVFARLEKLIGTR